MHFVLVHGWGFHAGLWRGLSPRLGNAGITLVDLGFLSGGPEGATEWPENAIGVGHSLGLLWLLHHAARADTRPFSGLVSIQGFDAFTPHVLPARVLGMRRSLGRNAYATLLAFWRSAGTEPFAPDAALNVDRLDEGLGWLLDWNESETCRALGCPILALAARDDAIVPEAMSKSLWADTEIRWSQTGGHVLPLKHPEWCAHHVLDFAHALRP